MQVWSGIRNRSPQPHFTVLRLQMTDTVKSKEGKFHIQLLHCFARGRIGAHVSQRSLFSDYTEARVLFYTLKKDVFCSGFFPVIFWNIANSTVILPQFLDLKWKVSMCLKYWYSHAVLMKTIQRSCSFLELEKQVPTPSVSLAVVLAENWHYRCFLFQTYLFNDFCYTMLNDYPVYKRSSTIRSQFSGWSC